MKRFTYFIIALILLSGNASFSQNKQKVDSLTLLINKAPEDSNKVNLYYTLSRYYDPFKSKEHIEYNLSALNLSQKINFTRGIKRHYSNLIRLFFQRGVYDMAIAYHHVYENYLIENDFKDDLLTSYNMYGNLLCRQKKYKEALKYYHIAKAYQFSKNNYFAYANVLNNLSILSIEIGQYDSALIYSSNALSIFKKTNENASAANSILGIAEIYLKKGDHKNAESKVLESMEIYQAMGQNHGLSNCNYVLGQIYLETGKYDEAIIATKKSLIAAQELHFPETEKDCLQQLSKLYHLLHNDTEAYNFHVLYKKCSDSLATENLQGKMLEMEVKYDISKKEGQLKEQEFEIESKNKQRNYLALIVIVILILFFISFRAYTQKKKANKIIFEQKKLVEEKQQEVLDSIRYAKRIQESLLPKEKYMQKVINKLKGL